ncbi:MAG: phage tail tape measure protein, partial [Gammaproteobacteria bacterium]|nr:phage tail tape measure protein [Gammaproteobacteria bacterium]
ADLIRAAIQALIVRAIAAAFTGGSSAALPGINSAALSGGTKLGSAGAGFTLPGFAAGGVFEDAAFRAGGVVDKPTYFGFGRERRIGLAGEAGPEAILPLERGPDGGLGVRAGGAGRPIQVHVHVNAADAADFDTLLLRRRRMISEMVADAMAQDGGR